MRSLVIILVTLGLLLIGFFLYEFMQPSLAPLNNEPYDSAVATQPVATSNHMGIGPGQGVWIERHDPNTGRMSERFKGNHYDWNSDETMKVETPQAEFFLAEGRVLRINGVTGNVVVEQAGPPGKSGGITMSQPAAPSRGNMKDVTIRLFESVDAPTPTLTVTMDNATFDTQINRIYTEAATINGQMVAADRIPVHMRGQDEDFDGFGLQIRWDQKDNKLQLLQVDHGQRLLIKHPNNSERTGRAGTPTTITAANTPAAVRPGSPEPEAARPQGASNAKPVVSSPPPAVQIYRASFQDNVRVTQGGEQLAKADEMQIDFVGQTNNASPVASPSPSTPARGEQGRSGEGRGGGPSASSVQSSALNNSPHPSPPPEYKGRESEGKSSPLGDQPILITWSGKLIVTPYDEPGPLHADTHGQVITFLGAPMVVHQKGTQVVADYLAYGASQEELIARGTAAHPAILSSSDGARVVTELIDYRRHEQQASLSGAGHVFRPLKSANGQAQSMTAAWSRSCHLTFFGSDEHDLTIHTADLDGGVNIDHPQVKLTSDQLAISFFPPAPGQQPDLDHLHATGSVDALVTDMHGKSQAIQSQTLDLTTASVAGLRLQPQTSSPQRYISRLLATGNVWAHDPESEIRSQFLDAELIPAPASQQTAGQLLAAIQLQHLIANTDVHVHGKNNALASADNLDVKMDAGQASQVILKGRPARAQKGQDITIANEILLHPRQQIYYIPGAGTMHLARTGDNNSPPTDVAWQSNLYADLNKNSIDIDRGVIVKTTSTDQAHNTATSDHLHITLEDKPVIQAPAPSAIQQGHAHSAENQPLFGNAGNADLAGQKQAKSLTMLGNVKVQSMRGDDTGHLLQQFNLESSRLDYAIPEQKMVCPQPGRILFYDNRRAVAASAPSAPAAAAPAPAPPNNPFTGGNARGLTAIKYDGSLIYDQAAGKIVLNKNIFLRHEPLDKSQSPIELRSQHMTVDLLKSGEKAAPDQMSISHLLATDQVLFSSKTMQCQAASIDYTPATGIFIIRGAPYQPAVMYDEQGASKGTFQTMYYNSKTEQIDRMDGFHSNVRRGAEIPGKDLGH